MANSEWTEYLKWKAHLKARGYPQPRIEVFRRIKAQEAVEAADAARVKEAVRAGVVEALAQLGEPDPEPPFDATDAANGGRALQQRYGVEGIFRDRQPGDPGPELPHRPSAGASTARTKRIEAARAAVAAAGGGLNAPVEVMEELAAALGVDHTAVSTALFMPVKPAAPQLSMSGPDPRSNHEIADAAHKASSRARAAAEAAVDHAEAVARQSGTPVDTRRFSSAEFAVYRERRGLNPDGW